MTPLHGRLARSRPRRGRHGRARLGADRAAPGRRQQLLRAAARSTTSAPPSFHVSPDEKLYHCFGCQASGDAFKFVMETEGLDFKGALESLADRFGVQLADRGRGSAGGVAPRAARAAALAARPGRGLLRALPGGVRRGGAGARVPARAGASASETLQRVPRRLRAERVGPDPARLAQGGLQRRGAADGRPRPALEDEPGTDLRPLPRADHVPGDRRPRARARASARARCATTSCRST